MCTSTLNSTHFYKRQAGKAERPGGLLSRVKQGWLIPKFSCCFLLITICIPTYADIYFSSRTIGPSTNIYAVNEDGELKKITDNSAWMDTQMHFSSTGEVVFMSNRKNELRVNLNKASEDFNIFKLALDGGEIEQISFAPEMEHSPTFSKDGRWIAYIEKAGKFRKLMLLKNGELTPGTLAIADDIRGFSWSPNNHMLSFVSVNKSNSSMYIVDILTGEKQKLLEVSQLSAMNKEFAIHADMNAYLPTRALSQAILASAQWSPDGKKIAYILASTQENKRELYVLDLWQRANTLASDSSVQVQYPVSWSPDSKRLLYSALVDYNFYFDEKIYKKVYEGSMQIYLANTEGKYEQLTEGEYMHNRPVFSPDGNYIAFLFGQSLADRTLKLHTMSLQDQQRREYYDRVAGDSLLYWQ